jgi:hypothetical protein
MIWDGIDATIAGQHCTIKLVAGNKLCRII